MARWRDMRAAHWIYSSYLFLIANHNNPRNRPYGAPGLKNDRPGFKNDRPGLKNDRKFDNFADKNQDSCSQANKEIRANGVLISKESNLRN